VEGRYPGSHYIINTPYNINMSINEKQMTDYGRLVTEWENVAARFRECVRTGTEVKLADFLRTRGVDSKKTLNDAIGAGGHKDYLRHITKNTECLKQGTNAAERLRYASGQLQLYKDKQGKQAETGAGFIRTEVTRTVEGGIEAKAGTPKPAGEKKERVPGAITSLLKALEEISECEENWQGIASAALTDYKAKAEARKARAEAKKGTPVLEVDEKLEDEFGEISEASEESEEESEASEEEELPADAPELPGTASEPVPAPAPAPAPRTLKKCQGVGCRSATMDPTGRDWEKKDGAWYCPCHK